MPALERVSFAENLMDRCIAPWLVAGILFASTAARAAEAPVADPVPVATIGPADALAHEGEECTVEMVVRAARKLPGKNVCFLNSMPDHRAEGNFTVVIFKAGLERLASDGIEDPAERFLDARIRVRGVVEKRDGRPQIVVDEPGQISIVEPDEAP
jgi:DNA/RNA endonuclease YhcR with UshA esterase domain